MRVALVGVRCTDLKPAEEAKIVNDLLNLLQLEPSLVVVTPDESVRILGSATIDSLILLHSIPLLDQASQTLGVEYLFFGDIRNESRDRSRTLLAGRYYRFDRVTSALFSIEILKYYESFHEELITIRREFVETILPREGSILLSWPVLLLFGITVVGMMALILKPGKASLEGTNNPPPTEN